MSHREHDDPSMRDADAAITRAWREVSTEAPPPPVDARILAAAREAAARQDTGSHRVRAIEPHSQARWTWRPLLAAAAVAGIAFAILPPLLRQAERPVQPRAERSTNAPVAPQPVQPEHDATIPAPAQIESNAMQTPSSAAPAPPVAAASPGPAATVTAPVERELPAPDTPGAAAAKSAESAATAEPPMAGEPAAVTGGSGSLSRADRVLQSAPAALSRPPALITPTDHAAKIAALYDAGDVNAAAAELRAFRATRPDADAYLPSALQPWARTVK